MSGPMEPSDYKYKDMTLDEAVAGMLNLDPNLKRRGVLSPYVAQRDEDNTYEWAVPEFIVELAKTVMLPRHVQNGGEATYQDATNAALNMTGGGLLARRPRGSLGMGGTPEGKPPRREYWGRGGSKKFSGYADHREKEWMDKTRGDYEENMLESGMVKGSRTTGKFDQPMRVPTKLLNSLPGESGEHAYRYSPYTSKMTEKRHDGLSLLDSIKQKGFQYDKEDPYGIDLPLITVDNNGQAWITEGNHRITAAHKAGLADIPVRIEYRNGSESLDNGFHPEFIEELDSLIQNRSNSIDTHPELNEVASRPFPEKPKRKEPEPEEATNYYGLDDEQIIERRQWEMDNPDAHPLDKPVRLMTSEEIDAILNDPFST